MMLAGPPSRKGMGADHDDEAHRPESHGGGLATPTAGSLSRSNSVSAIFAEHRQVTPRRPDRRETSDQDRLSGVRAFSDQGLTRVRGLPPR